LLSIGKIRAGQESYYSRQVAAGRDDYYSGKGEAPGEWAGRGAASLGLEGEVDPDDFRALMGATDPGDGTALADGRGSIAAFDLTFSAPKSVSVLYAVADDSTSRALRDAHDEAVQEALSYLEREACRVRRGRGGYARLGGQGFASAAYRHRMSRAQDPQLHTHVVTANLAKGSDGRYSRLDGRALYAHAKAAGYLYEAHLRHAVRERLPWVRWTEPIKGIAEIEGVPSEVLREFSQRRQQIDAWLAERGADPADRTAAERAALSTRGPKRAAVETSSWREAARTRAAEHGLGQEELQAVVGREPPAPRRIDDRALADEFAGPTGLTERQSTFRERDALIALSGADRDGSPRAEIEQRVRGFLGRWDVVSLPDPAEPRYTTTELLQREEEILAGAQRRGGERTGALRPDAVERALDFSPVALSEEQRAAVRCVATSADGVVAVEALAGTGKTTLAGALARAYERSGYRVIGAAPTARAARELRERAGIGRSVTLARLRGELRSDGGFGPEPAVLIVDEAGMAHTREAASILTFCERAGVKVVAIGDPGQLASVQAGGWFASLVSRQGAARLTEVVRQRDAAERRALALVHDGAPGRYLELKGRRGELRVHAEASEAEAELVERWWQKAETLPDGEAVMIARRNDLRVRLNELARERMRTEGRLGDSVETGGREFSVGDRVIARRNDAGRDLDNGMRGTVREVDRDTGELTVETHAAGIRRLHAAYVHEHLEHAYALTGHGMQGATVEWAGVIGRPEDFTSHIATPARAEASRHGSGSRRHHRRSSSSAATRSRASLTAALARSASWCAAPSRRAMRRCSLASASSGRSSARSSASLRAASGLWASAPASWSTSAGSRSFCVGSGGASR
jgi:conjugative relaxase-like TrwC/TraI family protein